MPPPERIDYGDHASQFCELFLPAAEGPHPVVALIHGGFWRQRYDRTLQHDLARSLAAQGWAAWNLEYRRIGGDGGWPATFEDVAAAVDALQDLEGLLALDALVTAGHSAGGHLAVWAAARHRLPRGAPGAAPAVRVAAAVAQAGAIDLAETWRRQLSSGVAAELMGGGPEEVPAAYAVASPAELLPIGVPMLLVHGSRDDVVPVQMSRDFAEAARAAGDACDFVEVPHEAHFEHLDPSSASWKAVRRWLPSI